MSCMPWPLYVQKSSNSMQNRKKSRRSCWITFLLLLLLLLVCSSGFTEKFRPKVKQKQRFCSVLFMYIISYFIGNVLIEIFYSTLAMRCVFGISISQVHNVLCDRFRPFTQDFGTFFDRSLIILGHFRQMVYSQFCLKCLLLNRNKG